MVCELYHDKKNTAGTMKVNFTKIGKIREGAHVGEKGRICFGHGKFEIPVRIQVDLLSRQLEICLQFRGEIRIGDIHLGKNELMHVIHLEWCLEHSKTYKRCLL